VYALQLELTENSHESEFLGYDHTRTESEVSGSTWVQYHPDRPRTFMVPVWDEMRVTTQAITPAAYVIPAALTDIIERLDLHHIDYRRLETATALEVGTWQFESVSWAPRPFENRHMVREFVARPVTRTVDFAAGSVVVPTSQRAANVVMHLLEPKAPDSLLRWGLLDHIFESKEYAEPRVIERMAREMMEADPDLRAEFERRVAEDAAFAADARARLYWFYQRTPWFDERLNLYPIGRLDRLPD
jgi:hypothetical protein